MNNELKFMSDSKYLEFSILKNIFGSICILIITGSIQFFVSQNFFFIILTIVLILVPFDIFYEYMYLKSYTIKLDNRNVYIYEGFIIRKTTVIPKRKIYTIIETDYIYFKKYWKKMELKTIVKDYKLQGMSLNSVIKIKEEVHG